MFPRQFFQSIQVLWNLLEKGNVSEVASQLSSEESISPLKEAFQHQMLQVEQQSNKDAKPHFDSAYQRRMYVRTEKISRLING